MLILEAAAIVGITVLCFDILRQVHPSREEVLSTWKPSPEFGGWTGLGFGMVFSFLCFAGFEGAACLGEETQHPRRNIPIALFGTLIFSGLFFAFVAYCEVVGFGPHGIRDLAKASTPLNDLALRYASPRLAIALDLAAAVSCFSGVIGGLAAAGRILFALGRAGLSPALGEVHPVYRQPCAAVSVAAIMIIVPFVLWGPFAGAAGFYSATSTIGVLALILIYIGVGLAEVVEAWGRRPLWAMLCLCGPVLLLWVLYRNLYPIPEFPNNLWPYVALAWLASSALIIRSRPAVGRSGVVTAG
jgi:amino acid transporter